MEFLREFNEIGRNDIAVAGGKGASLGEITRAGFPVPPGFVVLSTAYDKVLQESGLLSEINRVLNTVVIDDAVRISGASRNIQALIHSAKIPHLLTSSIETAFDRLGSKFVAVRSSASAEDSSRDAWAGQLESYLNVTKEHLLDHIRMCWASLFTTHAISYRFRKRLEDQNISVAVVIQKMIDSDVSGVGFSVHPTSEAHDQMVIEAGFGLGEAIVSDQVNFDRYVVGKTALQILEKKIATQGRELRRSDGGGIEWRSIERTRGTRPKLADEEILSLSRLMLDIERHFGFPCDIEWAQQNRKFFIVQSRPITTLGRRIKDEGTSITDRARSIIAAFDSEQYRLQFKTFGLQLIYADILAKNYYGVGAVLAFADNVYRECISKRGYEGASAEGVEFYGSKVSFQNFKRELASEFTTSLSETSSLSVNASTKTDVEKFFYLLKKMFFVYTRMDPLFTDGVFLEAKANTLLMENITEVGLLKDKYRQQLNELAFEDKSHLKTLLARLAQSFGVESADLYWYTLPEIIALFNGKSVEQEELDRRKLGYILLVGEKQIDLYTGIDAAQAARTLQRTLPSARQIKGVVACEGKQAIVTGFVRKIDSSLSNFAAIQAQISEMKRGEILVVSSTGPELMDACLKAAAIVADVGGLVSHAAIVSRELLIPCIIETNIGTDLLNTGDLVEVNATKGLVRLL
jgi:phosphoenolpyruvate synthase/pyruvate phosphate dikinase